VKLCGAAAIAFLAFIALCPADWVPRTNLGFVLDHFLAKAPTQLSKHEQYRNEVTL
jgi:hypothetical protein